MSAETLRRAATLMRERAQAALDDLDANDYWGQDDRNWHAGVEGGLGGAAGRLSASMSPWVTLAVADYLDAEALCAAGREATTPHPGYSGSTYQALAVARAYLGAA